ncbi:hypothetical protein Bbelb_021170 [Branchiostoma belcheri]|nr:hypothetical protein Bbelb_021170 [Branchiostoma belcheri]
MRHHGVLTSDPKEKVDALGDQFSSVFTEEDLTNIPSLGRPVAPHAPPLYISVNGVAKQLSKLNPNKASGPDGLSPRLLKTTATQIAPVLQVIFTQSLDTGDVPADWRAANISPIFKKGDKTSPVNYRPVVRLFADDCLLYRVIDKPSDALDLQKDLDALTRWQDTWQMSFNPSKCHTLHITQHLYAHTWSTVRLYGIPTPSVVPRRWSESNEGRREWLTINEWNKLPGQLVKAQTVEAFKAGLLAAQP